jgi:lipoprotein-anchoring transpeptidase ErfK/SrfK
VNDLSVLSKSAFLRPALFVVLFSLIGMAGAAWLAISSPAFAADLETPAPTQPSLSFAPAGIAKPTYTPIPTASPIPTVTPTEAPTATQEAVIQAEIVSEPLPYDYVTSVTGGDPEAPAFYTGGKSILVDISEQHMYVYEGDLLVYSFVASTGMNNATRVGSFSVLNKIPNAYGATWNIWMPNWLGIYWSGNLQNGIHALPILPSGATLWAGFLGTPISYGCVVLGSYESQLLYNWAEIGTPVNIQW